MTTLDPEGLERAAEAAETAWLNEDGDVWREIARAAVTAYLEHVNPVVDSVEDLDALPVGSVVLDKDGVLTAGTAHNGRRIWDYTGNDIGAWSEDIPLPARVINWPDNA